MAISVIQRAKAGDTGGITGFCAAAFGSNVTSGSAIIAIGFIGATSNAGLSTPTDTRGNTFNPIANINDGSSSIGMKAWIAYGTAAGADTVTMSDGSNISTLFVFEVSGLAASAAFDKIASAYQSSSTALSSGNTPTTGFANELLLGAFGLTSASGLSWTVGSGYSNLQTQATAFCESSSEEEIVSSTGAYAATATLAANTGNSLSVILTFSNTAIGPTVANDPGFYKQPTNQPSMHYTKPLIKEY